MLRWGDVHRRLQSSREFIGAFGKNSPAEAFSFKAFTLRFESVAAATIAGAFGVVVGPNLQAFPSGGVVLGITAGCLMAQQGSVYPPSMSFGRRDLFALSVQYADGELVTPLNNVTVGAQPLLIPALAAGFRSNPRGLANAEALLGSGEETVFPAKEILVTPGNGLMFAVASQSTLLPISVHVVCHAMVYRGDAK